VTENFAINFVVKAKKVVPAPAMRAYRGSAGIPPVILKLDTRNCT